MNRNVDITITSVIDDETNIIHAVGEYGFRNGEHMLAYTDYSGNSITKTGLFFNDKKVLLHRVGAVNGDMLFEPMSITSTMYEAFGLKTMINIQTHSYSFEESEHEMRLCFEYALDNQSDQAFSNCSQEIVIRNKAE